jgi:hypothetical protein
MSQTLEIPPIWGALGHLMASLTSSDASTDDARGRNAHCQAFELDCAKAPEIAEAGELRRGCGGSTC